MEPLIVINGDPREARLRHEYKAGFNGAVDRDQRRQPRPPGHGGRRGHASMEPLIVINGDSTRAASRDAGRRSFNGAVDRDQRRRTSWMTR